MLRCYAGQHVGATAFFRNRPLLHLLSMLLAEGDPASCRVFFHACSIGAEPYSFALWHLRHPWPLAPRRLEIVATDIEPEFLAIARRGVYPASVLDGMSPDERGQFELHPEGVRVPAAARALVRFLPPASLLEPVPEGPFDALLIMNALTHMTPAEQRTAIARAASGTRRILGVTAFHPDSIKSDMRAAGFVPIVRDLEAIHEAWGPRVTSSPIQPGSRDYSWRLPPYDAALPEADYRFCSLFTRSE